MAPSKQTSRLEPAVLESLIASAIKLDRQIKDDERRLKSMKAQLMIEASLRPEDHSATEGGGSSWTFKDTVGNIARVTFPADKLKERIDPGSKDGAKILKLVGRSWPRYFRRLILFAPLDDFRARVETNLDYRDARKLINACETNSDPKVSFETAQTPTTEN